MTDNELQDLISLKKYEQPEDGYFDDFLVEFQQRQRSEMLKTSARGLLIERAKAWFSEFGAMRWLIGAGAAYATVAIVLSFSSKQEADESGLVSEIPNGKNIEEGNSPVILQGALQSDEDDLQTMPLSMVYNVPIDFSSPAPAFSADERIF